jgi:hypothetical protein
VRLIEMKKIIILLIVSILLVSFLTGCEEIFDAIFGGDIDITSPADGTVTGSYRITISVEATYQNIDFIDIEVNGDVVYTSSESEFSTRVKLEQDSNTITAICYIDDHEYAGEDSITVYYDKYPPVIDITDPADNWSSVMGPDVTIDGAVTDTYGIASFAYMDEYGIYHSLSYSYPSGNWSLDLTELDPGIYSYMFRAQDNAGHSIVRAITFIVE